MRGFLEKFSSTNNTNFVKYIKNRGFELEDVKDFKLGYYTKNLFYEKKFGIPNFFSSAVVLPIFDDMLHPVGFELRSIKSKAHFKHYGKGRYHFFGMTDECLDEIYKTKTVFLTEGTFDKIALSLWKPNVLSLMTNKISDKHLKFLKRYVKNIYLCFDWDKWGIIQQKNWTQRIIEQGFNVENFPYIKGSDRVKDANKLLEKLGKERFIRTLKKTWELETCTNIF